MFSVHITHTLVFQYIYTFLTSGLFVMFARNVLKVTASWKITTEGILESVPSNASCAETNLDTKVRG